MQDDDIYKVGKLNEDTLRKLELSGLRMTMQRRHIIEILTTSQCTSPKELWYEAKQYVPDLGIATVYRLINRLEQIGVLSKSRSLGMQSTSDLQIVSVLNAEGKELLSSGQSLELNEVLRDGLAARGLISATDELKYTQEGDKVLLKVLSKRQS
ncbi:MAG: transcriptional repressor [Succinivibrio sp.]|nr:transcriptional repressor [Succinivibrio sp.]